MKTVFGIHGWSSYLPGHRMERATIGAQIGWLNAAATRAKGCRSVANWDEDALTMAVAALRKLSVPFENYASLTLASTTQPFADRSNVGLVAAATGLDRSITLQDVSGSLRSATAAISQVAKSLDVDRAHEHAVIVGSDRRIAQTASAAELRYGDAAASLALGVGAGAAQCLASQSVHHEFVHQYRASTDGAEYLLEDRWVRDEGVLKIVPDVLRATLKEAKLELSQIDHLVTSIPAHHAQKLCQRIDIEPTVLGRDLHFQLGETGTADTLLKLAVTLERAKPEQTIVVVGFGQGCDVTVFRTTAELDNCRPKIGVEQQIKNSTLLEEYLKLPVFSRVVSVDHGIRGEADKRTALSVLARRSKEINAMQGSCCTACHTPHFPAARVCVACQAVDQMNAYEFAHRVGQVKTFTEDWQSVTPAPPLCYGNVEFEGGGNAFLEFTDVVPNSLVIGAEGSMQFRIKDFDDRRGFRRYFWKFVCRQNIEQKDRTTNKPKDSA